jgi:hypothetical protein
MLIAALFETVLKTPLLVVIFRNFLRDFSSSLGIEISTFILGIICFGFLTFHNLVYRKIYTLRVKNNKMPWSIPNLKAYQLRYISKVAIVLFQAIYSHRYDSVTNYIPLLVVILIILQIIVNYHTHTCPPAFYRSVEIFNHFFESIVLSLVIVILINTFTQSDLTSVIIYIILLTIVFFGMTFVIEFFIWQRAIEALKSDSLKNLD